MSALLKARPSLSSQYQANLGIYSNLEARLSSALNCPLLLEHSGANIYRVMTRVKTLESFLSKIQRRGFPEDQVFQVMTDIVGARIICMFPEDLEKIHLYLTECGSFIFEGVPKVYLWDDLPWVKSDEFYVTRKSTGYGSIHYLARLSPALVGPNSELGKIVFEIQVRTLMQEAWAALEHAIGYKHDIPERIRGYFDSSAELLGVLDKAFQRLKAQSDKLEGELNEENSITPERLTLFSLKGFIRRRFHDNLPGTQLAPLLEEYRLQKLNLAELVRITNSRDYLNLVDELCRDLLKRPAATCDFLHWVCTFRRATNLEEGRRFIEDRIRGTREFQECHTLDLIISVLRQLGDKELTTRLQMALTVRLAGRQLMILFGPGKETAAEYVKEHSGRLVEVSRMIFGPINQVTVQVQGK
ncbi:MAG: hypothetical protein K1Y36_12810 [Blastocatellia bacterium]|nr:hypothetical protein [Blastocatellia bacterium]